METRCANKTTTKEAAPHAACMEITFFSFNPTGKNVFRYLPAKIDNQNTERPYDAICGVKPASTLR